jgi:hypothetical protein
MQIVNDNLTFHHRIGNDVVILKDPTRLLFFKLTSSAVLFSFNHKEWFKLTYGFWAKEPRYKSIMSESKKPADQASNLKENKDTMVKIKLLGSYRSTGAESLEECERKCQSELDKCKALSFRRNSTTAKKKEERCLLFSSQEAIRSRNKSYTSIVYKGYFI